MELISYLHLYGSGLQIVEVREVFQGDLWKGIMRSRFMPILIKVNSQETKTLVMLFWLFL
jgi:hypothetical protein